MSAYGYAFGQKGLTTFRVLADGHLKPISVTPIPGSHKGGLLAVDSSGQWLCTAPLFVPESVGDGNPVAKPWRKTTPLTFFTSGASGCPTHRTRITVPITAISLIPCPTGKRLFVDGGDAIAVLDVRQGIPVVRSILRMDNGYLFTSHAGVRDDISLSLSPDGRYAFRFRGTGFVDHSENFLDIFRVTAKGRLLLQTEEPLMSTSKEQAGPVWMLRDGQTVVMNSFGLYRGLWKAGKFHSLKRLDNKITLRVIDPRGRFFIAASYYAYNSLYRRVAPGKLAGVATSANLIGYFCIEPGGRFLYSQEEGKLKTWRINANCTLTYLRQEPWPQERGSLQFPAR